MADDIEKDSELSGSPLNPEKGKSEMEAHRAEQIPENKMWRDYFTKKYGFKR